MTEPQQATICCMSANETFTLQLKTHQNIMSMECQIHVAPHQENEKYNGIATTIRPEKKQNCWLNPAASISAFFIFVPRLTRPVTIVN